MDTVNSPRKKKKNTENFKRETGLLTFTKIRYFKKNVHEEKWRSKLRFGVYLTITLLIR